MADAIAVLGLEVDATGALTNLKKFESATKASGDAAKKSADDVVIASHRITEAVAKQAAATRAQEQQARAMQAARKAEQDATFAQIDALMAEERARNRANNEARRAAQAAQLQRNNEIELAAAERAAALAATQAATANAANAASMTAAGAAATTATVGVRTLSGAMTALGGPIGVALLALSAYGVIADKVREHSEKSAKAAKEEREALEKLTQAQLSNNLARLEGQRAQLQQQRDTAGASGNLFGVLGLDKQLAAVTPQLKTAIDRLQELRATADGGKSAVGGLAASLADAQATLRAFKQGGEQGAAAYKLAASEWNRATGESRTLEAALRDHDQIAQALINRAREQVAIERQLSEAKGADARATRDQAKAEREREAAARLNAEINANTLRNLEAEGAARAAVSKIIRESNDAQANGARSIADDLEAQRQTLAILRATGEAARKLGEEYLYAAKFAQYLEDTRLPSGASDPIAADAAARAFVQTQREIDLARQKTQEWSDSLKTVVGVVQAIAVAFKSAGLAQAAIGTQSILSGIDRAKTATTATQGIGAAGAIAGGALAIADALDLFGTRARERARVLREQADAFNAAIDGFAIKNGTALEKQLADNFANANAVAKQGGLAGNFKSYDDIQKAIDVFSALGNERGLAVGVRENFLKLRDSLQDLLTVSQENERVLQQRNADELKALTEDADVRRLRALGLSDEADALAASTAAAREMDAAILKFGKSAAESALAGTLAAEAEKRLADARAEAARKVESERRSTFDLVNGAQAFTDSRGASQAAFEESQRRRLADASDKAAAELFNLAEAADRAARIAAQDISTGRELAARIAAALGNDREAQDIQRQRANDDAISAAIREGMTPTNFALLKLAQFAEASQVQMQRAIEDGTKAIQTRAANEIAANTLLIDVIRSASAMEIARLDDQIKGAQDLAKATALRFDEQIDAIREQTRAQVEALDVQIESARQALDAAKLQQSTLEKSVATQQRVVESLRAFLDTQSLGDTSSLSPERKLAEARRQFDALASQGGPDAALGLPAAANALLQASRAFNGSGDGFVNEEQRIRQIVEATRAQFGATLPTDLQALEAARAAVAGIERQIDQLGAQKDAFERASAKQIDLLQRAKDKAATDSAKQIEILQQLKQSAQDNASREIEKLQALNDGIQAAADRQVQQLVANETAAHADRVRQYEATQQLIATLTGAPTASLGTSGSVRAGQTPAPRTDPTQTAILDELRASRAEQRELRAELKIALEQLTRVTIGASEDEVQATNATTGAVISLASEVRSGLQAPRTNQRQRY